jgi:membrane protein DedA with SNARE-associated domain
MNNEYFLAILVTYGLPALFGVIVLAAIGLPLPATLLVIAAGSFVEQGTLDVWWVVGIASGAAIVGDHLGYLIGRWGGRQLVRRVMRWIGGEPRLDQAQATTRQWGGLGIFLSRWLFTPVGPALNLTSGITAYPWPRFTMYDIAGEVLWGGIYVTVGRVWSDRVQAMSEVLGDATWALVGAFAVLVLGWQVLRSARRSQTQPASPPSMMDGTHSQRESTEYDMHG